MKFRYNEEKNTLLLEQRGIGFKEILEEINGGKLIDTKSHHNQEKYPNQSVFHVKCLEQVYVVPYVVEEDGTFFLKTLYPSRKATKHFLKKDKK